MKNKILAAVAILGLFSGVAQASITINGVHETASPNSIESYFFQAVSGGSSDIFLSSAIDPNTQLYMNGALSVWQQVGSNWQLVGANNDAPFTSASNLNSYGVAVHDYTPSPLSGISDPGLTLNLTAGANYLVIQSDYQNGPTSLANGQDQTGALGQTIAIGSNLQAALWGTYDPFGQPASGLVFNNFALTITGNVLQTSGPAAVPVPAAIWLFGSALAGLGVIGRKKSEPQLFA